MNYIILNERGRLAKKNIDDIYAGSSNADTIYIFADFDVLDKSVGVMFQRSDGFKIGEVEALPGTAIHPITELETPCFSIVLETDVLCVSGPLQISVKYYSDYIEDTETYQEVKGVALVTVEVHETISAVTYKNIVITNINRKIDALAVRVAALENLKP